MIRSACLVAGMKRLAAVGALLASVAVGTIAVPQPANAWWSHGYGYGWCCGVRIYVPPVVIAPAPVPAPIYAPAPVYYAPAPTYYVPPQRVWIPAHWQGGYWIQGHWS